MKVNTSRPKQLAKKNLNKVRLRYLAQKDISRFSKTASFSIFDDGYEQVVSRIMYNVHALEKGLARNRDIRLGFGKKALSNLNDALVVYRSRRYDESAYAYVQGLSVIQRYKELHSKADFDIAFLDEIIDPEFLNPGMDYTAAGTKTVRRVDKERNSEKGFRELALGRSSVREFSGDPIDTTKVMAALKAAEKTPSVCNRQGWKVYWVEDKDLAAKVLKHQRGFGYALMPEVMLCITVSNNTFLSPVERNQSYIDGGLFSMSVMYGLESEGLAAVPLNACMYHRDQLAVRELLDIDESENIIMFMAIGSFPDESVSPISDRKSAESFVKRRGTF